MDRVTDLTADPGGKFELRFSNRLLQSAQKGTNFTQPIAAGNPAIHD